METPRRGSRARVAALGVAAGVLLAGCGTADEPGPGSARDASAAAGAGPNGTITGAGASSQQAAMQAWITWFTRANPDATVNYEPSGSGTGRSRFIAGDVAFAGSDAYLRDDELRKAKDRCQGDVVEVPAYVSPIAVVYNLPGVSDLQLSPATVAKIFLGRITQWNAGEIAADNPGRNLPAQAITPVHRSDDSGTTQNFTGYLRAASGGAWTADPKGVWPIPGGAAAQGTSGMVEAVRAGDGTIGYADESQAGDLGTARIEAGGRYTGPTPEAAAAALGVSRRVEGRGETSFAYELTRDATAAGTYPIVLVSYLVACAKYAEPAQADLVKGLLTYAVSADGQRAAAQAAGSAPLPDDLRGRIAPAVAGITGGA